MAKVTIGSVRHYFSTTKNADPIRVDESVARELLLYNAPVIHCGTVYWFKIYHIGLGVYEISLNTKTKKTELVICGD